jgi:serine/threonine protein kinase
MPEMEDNPSSGRYEIIHLIGTGGFGHIYNGRDRKDNKQVAIKTVVNNFGTPSYLDREFDILSRLSHPNIVHAFEKFRLDGRLCFAMEKIDGVPLMQAIGSPCGTTLDEVGVRAFGQLQNGLDYLHENNIVHAELSPGNLLVDEFGVLRIVDFEHCRVLGADESEFWPEGSIAGTPMYMSPEHLTAKLIPQSDYFVVGTLLFEALTHKRPFPGRDISSILQQISVVDAATIITSQPDIVPDLQETIKYLLSRDVSQRERGWDLLQAFTRHYVPFEHVHTREGKTVSGKPKAFISHASADKQIARRLALELARIGVDVWLDEWEIKVGESISRKIDDALDECRYLILLLSPTAVKSKWVEKEWRAAFWREMDYGNVVILPTVVTACDIPPLLRDKKYADLSTSFDDGLRELIDCFE